jgi:non-canonical (house-cleaning) NTP pyrophosphatase
MPTSQTLRVIVGSKSTHKVNAVIAALARCNLSYMEVHGCATKSGVSEQPVGFEETFVGAMTRAQEARKADPGAFLAVGIENGLLRTCSITLDFAVVVLLDLEGNVRIASSPGILFPEADVDLARDRAFKTTSVGQVLAETHGGDPTDPYPILSRGRITRVQLLTEALCVAFQTEPVDTRA